MENMLNDQKKNNIIPKWITILNYVFSAYLLFYGVNGIIVVFSWVKTLPYGFFTFFLLGIIPTIIIVTFEHFCILKHYKGIVFLVSRIASIVSIITILVFVIQIIWFFHGLSSMVGIW